MKIGHCCRRARWAMPGVLLLVLPKCPACLAAYIAASTGLGISIATAEQLRGSLVIVCILILAALTLKTAAGLYRKHQHATRKNRALI